MKKYLSIALVAIFAFAGVRFVAAQEAETGKAVAMDNAVMGNTVADNMVFDNSAANEETDADVTMDEENNEAMDEVKGDAVEKDASAPVEAVEKKTGY